MDNINITEDEMKLKYRAYCIKMLCLDMEDFIDAEHLTYEEFKEKELIKVYFKE